MSENNVLLLNSFFDMFNDELYIVLKDVDSGKKVVKKEKNPKIPVYIVKGNKDIPDYYMEYRDKKDLKKEMVSYRWREWDIARAIGYDSFTHEVRQKNIKKEHIYLDKRVFGADLRLRDRVIMDYLDSFKTKDKDGNVVYPDDPPIKNLHIGYFDLEWDIKHGKNEKDYPIYLMTYVDDKDNITYTYYLENTDFKRQKELKDTEKFIQSLKDDLDKDFNNIKLKDKKKEKQVKDTIFKRLNKMEYVIKKYKSEKKMIKDFYKLIFRKHMPDFLYAYNTNADLGQTLNRCDVLNIKPSKLFTHPDIGDYFYFNMKDNTFPPHKRRHNFECASYTKIMDMFITYHSVRSADNFTSYKLDTVAKDTIGTGKLDYSHICNHIQDLPYKDFVVTTKYNIRDTLVMPFIEDTIQDTKTILSKKFITRTDYDLLFVPMKQVMNAFYHMGERNGQIYSNEINKLLLKLPEHEIKYLKEEDRTTYDIIMAIKNGDRIEGGLCTDPNLVSKKGINILPLVENKKVFETVIDADASSMYPNNLISSNISKTTLIGRLIWVDGFYKDIIKEIKDFKDKLIITEDEWETIKKLRSTSNSNIFQRKNFIKKYNAIEHVGYEELNNSSLVINLKNLFKTYDLNLQKLFDLCDGDTIYEETFVNKFDNTLTVSERKHHRMLFQMYIKKILDTIGEKTVFSIIQRNIFEIGKIFFNLPSLMDLENIINSNRPKKINLDKNKKETKVNLEKDKNNKKLLSILSKIDRSKFNKKDLESGIYNTNGLFLINDKPKNYIRKNSMIVEYYLEKEIPLTDIFELENKVYTDRRGNVSNYIYEEQVKPKDIPSLKKPIYNGKIEKKYLEELKQTDLIMRRIIIKLNETKNITLNLIPRMIPCLKKIKHLDINIYETGYDDIFDIVLSSSIKIKKPIEDKFIFNQYMRVLNY